MPTGDGPATGAERVRDHHERQRKRGLKLIRVWVPGESAEQVRRLAADLRKEAGKSLLHDREIPASPQPSRSPKKAAQQKKRGKSEEKPKKRRSPGKERRYQRRKAERAERSK